jgi:arabinofuranosyltransferase
LTLGIALYLVYLVKIGGDYMSMRFFSTPFAIGVVLLCRLAWLQRPPLALTCLAAALGLSWMMPGCPLRTGADHGRAAQIDVTASILDLRLLYYKHMGLLPTWHALAAGHTPLPCILEAERNLRRDDPPWLKPIGTAGRRVFREAAAVHAVDRNALGDALLARLPMANVSWRPGHYRRHIPAGYDETLLSGENRLADPNLALYYDHLKLIIAGPLWDPARWHSIWMMNTGQLDHLIDLEHYRRTGLPPAH